MKDAKLYNPHTRLQEIVPIYAIYNANTCKNMDDLATATATVKAKASASVKASASMKATSATDKINNKETKPLQQDADRNQCVEKMIESIHKYLQKSNLAYVYRDDNVIIEVKKKQLNINAPEFIPRTTTSESQSHSCCCDNDVNENKNTNRDAVPPNKRPRKMVYKPSRRDTDKANENDDNDYNDGNDRSSSSKQSASTRDANQASIKKRKAIIEEDIANIHDLISMCKKYPIDPECDYNINMKAIHDIREPLEDLARMVGMESLKRNIVDQILYFVQNLHLPRKSHTETQEQGPTQGPTQGQTQAPDEKDNDHHTPSHQQPTIKQFIIGYNRGENSDGRPRLFDLTALFTDGADGITRDSQPPPPPPPPSSNSKKNKPAGDFMHTVIYGPPGTGKTEVAKIMGRIFSKLGILKNQTFKKVTRHDMIAGYLGQTAIKTRDVIKESLGGVLFIDEAYSLGNAEKRDSFAKECIDTLCEALSDHKDNWMVIIAGYEKELNDCFFNYNEGLNSRFTWRFKLDGYTPTEMKAIFEKKVEENGWSIHPDHKMTDLWFEKQKDYFSFFGRDMETLFAKTKIAHSRRVFCLPESDKTKITLKDLEKGFELYLQNDEVKERKEKTKNDFVHSHSLYL